MDLPSASGGEGALVSVTLMFVDIGVDLLIGPLLGHTVMVTDIRDTEGHLDVTGVHLEEERRPGLGYLLFAIIVRLIFVRDANLELPNNQITQGDVSSHYVQQQQLTTGGTNADGRRATTPNNSGQQQQNAIIAGAVASLDDSSLTIFSKEDLLPHRTEGVGPTPKPRTYPLLSFPNT
ncbi:hypothetical protein A4A49_11420 [Nicotiana attenuata]|uniref:Uncharacterized protein n=1 Tax=Nicotiana attenuata TaxID=49451 RepID=A0A314KVV6_NICAT|nr:hypothetical protein A4A49_11420 [Nicotiana attenuata]